MRTVYIDSEFKCHLADDGTMTAVETDYFDGKCDYLVEGYCLEPSGSGEHIYPWKPDFELDAAQRAYEQELLVEYKNKEKELNISYQEGVNSI